MKVSGKKKKSKKKLVIGVGILAVAAVAGANIYGSRNAAENAVPQIEVVKAVRDNVQQTVETSGTVVSEEQKTYFSPVNAKVDVADVKEGETVKAGTKLIEFDQKDLEREEKKAELNVKSGKLDMQNTLNKSAEAVQKQQNAQGNAASLKQQVAAQEDYIANIKARISQANTNAQVAAAQEEARKQADATAAQAARAEAVQKAYAAAQKKYQNETLPAYQTQLNTLADEMNQAQTTYNQTETDYQMAFQTWSSEQSDENAAALDVAESARNDAQIAYQNAKSAYEDYKTQKPAAPAMNNVNSEIISDGNTADSIFSDSAETVTNNGSDTTVTADTSALEAELEKASNTLAELQSRLSSQQAVAESDPSAVTAEEKEKMEITNNLSELDQMSAQELVEAAKKGIKADFNGVITKVSVVEGATTALGTELFTLQNTDKINVNVNVSKYDYDKLKEGQSADITLAGKTYEGEVTSISHVATQNEKGASLISADVRIKNPDDDIFLGVDAKVTIHAEEADDVVVLPSEVVNIGKDGSFCYVIENGVITRRDITTGISSDDYVEVTEGIKEGDEVIRDLGSLEEGMQAEATLSESADNGSQSNLTDAEEGA
ncbi:efflux RND transporter periplasmic adaptor subunit [Ruminococcus sp. AF17-22AC]|uniref:efflux RND transporter periplasmic adaptor subunit n=1 Tax=Ruminococcus sp. AF17-22AC TaxID=2292248 RepID=UPI000E54A938|nr:efflux RND transporter periplasmic adaptor subunit [Ruminococcus sp. AF17-22AC]RGU30496.1 efflux RND transporter periplasmic adaptor subunit [Ruminococcus sp. AF17-22AC]